MQRRHCKTCGNTLHADDTHSECVSCLGKSHADAALIISRPQKDGGLRPILDLRLLNYALMKRLFRMITWNRYSRNMPRGLVHIAGSERCLLSLPGIPPSQTILEICIWRGGISIQGPAVWSDPGSPYFYMMHGCGSLPSATDRNLHTQLPRRLANSGPVAGGFNIAQDPPPQPLKLPGAQGQLCQEHTVTHPTSFVPGHSYRLSADDSNCLSGASHNNSRLPSGKVPPIPSKLSRKCWALWQRLRRYFSWVCFTCDPSSSGWSRGFYPWLGVTDATA